MVGVPGRSKACLTCKKRRIACDLQIPVCGPCTKSKRRCSFPQKHIFVVNDEGSHKTIYRKRANEPRQPGNVTSLPERCRGANGSNDSNAFDQATALDIIARPIGTLTAIKQQLLGDAFSNGTLLPTFDLDTRRPWTLTLAAFADSIHALNSAPLSCFASWRGRQAGLPYLVEASRRLYVQGLREVQEAVNDTASALRDETFGACLALIVYEALECPDRSRTGYYAHVEGCLRLVKLRGASMHQDGAAHKLFRAFRYIGVIQALEKHQTTFLASTAWTTLPWQTHPKNMYDRLIDLLALGPSVLEKGDQLLQAPPEQFLSALVEVVEEVRALECKLEAYYIELSESYHGPLYWETPSTVTVLDDHNSADDRNRLIPFRFRDIEIARILTLYWSMLAMVRIGLTDLYTTVEVELMGAGAEQVIKFLSLEPKDWLGPIRKVCQSVEFCTSEGPPGIGPLLLAVPLDMVKDIMKARSGCEPEYRAAIKARHELSHNWLRVLQVSD